MSGPSRYVEILASENKAFFLVRLVVDLGVGGQVHRQHVWSGRRYEQAILRAEATGRVARVPVFDRVIEGAGGWSSTLMPSWGPARGGKRYICRK